MPKKRININFDTPQGSLAQPASTDPNTFVDNSGEELRQLQMQMLKRRMQQQNDNDDLQINLKPTQEPTQPLNDQSSIDPQKYLQLKKMLGIS